VRADGTGDAPTIQAGIDSAAGGDTVLLGPGEYFTYETIVLKSGVSLVGELGPSETIITVKPGLSGPPVVGISMQSRSRIDGLWIGGFCTFANVNAYNLTTIRNCVILESTCSVYMGQASIEIVSCLLRTIECRDAGGIVLQNIILETVYLSGSVPFFECNDIVWKIPPFIAENPSNFSLDPQFCGIQGTRNYFLQEDSPCAPGNHPNPFLGCGLLGPFPVGCGTVKAESKTWGAIKGLYRE
jgi:hypothetical protein